jgi:hypothetical protein
MNVCFESEKVQVKVHPASISIGVSHVLATNIPGSKNSYFDKSS